MFASSHYSCMGSCYWPNGFVRRVSYIVDSMKEALNHLNSNPSNPHVCPLRKIKVHYDHDVDDVCDRDDY